MKLRILDIDNITKDLPEIMNFKEIENCKLSKTGLFSEQIFGPIKSYKCACSKSVYRGPHSNEKTCPICGVDICSNDVRSKRMAKITLPFPILNPLFYFILAKTSSNLKKIITDVLLYRYPYVIHENKLQKYVNLSDADKETYINKKLIGLDGVKKIIDHYISISPKKEFKYIKKYYNLIEINNILVIPPAFRNFSKLSNGLIFTDLLNKYYKEILIKLHNIKKMPYKLDTTQDIYKYLFISVQQNAIEISNFIIEKMSKKNGLIRKNLLGKRVDFSARSVISPDPTLSLNHCRLPIAIILEIFKPQLTVYLVNRKLYNRYNQASSAIDRIIKLKQYDELYEYIEDFVSDKVCFINRQPSLHRVAVLSFKIKLTYDNTIKIHPCICSALNADFDGDAAAVYIPIENDIKEDIQNKLSIKENLLLPSNGFITTVPAQDIVLGIYEITK